MSDNKEVMIEVSRDHLVEETSVKKYQLNHCATEFVSESSTENYGSDSSEDGEHVQEEGTEESLTREHEQGDKDEATMKEEGKAMQRRRSRGLEEQQQHVPYGNMPVTWGWESPQVRHVLFCICVCIMMVSFGFSMGVLPPSINVP